MLYNVRLLCLFYFISCSISCFIAHLAITQGSFCIIYLIDSVEYVWLNEKQAGIVFLYALISTLSAELFDRHALVHLILRTLSKLFNIVFFFLAKYCLILIWTLEELYCQ